MDEDQNRPSEPAAKEVLRESISSPRPADPARIQALRLRDAIEQGDLPALQEYSNSLADFLQTDEDGLYPLHRAVVQPQVSILETVLHASLGLTLEETTSEGETFLTLAVTAGWVDNVQLLLDYGASPHATNDRKESPLLLAVRGGSPRMVSCLLAGGARVGQVCLRKWTAVHEASRGGGLRVLELLLRHGGRVEETDQHGVTPLGIAAEYSHPDLLELLIQHGADVNAQAPNGDSVLYDAAGSGNPDCLNILLRHGANPNAHNLSSQLPIHRAAYEGNYLALRILIPVTTRHALRLSGQSPVHSAADGGHAHCLELLLQHGFDINVTLAHHLSENYGDMRRTPLFFTVSNGDTTCTDLLLRFGAKPDLDPLRCLLVAVRSGRYEIVRLLLAAGANVNCYMATPNNIAFPAALQFCLKDEVMLRLLLNHGYDAARCFCCNHGDNWEDLDESGYSNVQEGKVPFCSFLCVPWLENLAGRVISILLDYVGPVSLCGKLRRILEEQEEWPGILSTTGNARPLTHLSRIAIRKHLSCRGVPTLPLPDRIKDFLLFRDKDLYSQIVCRDD